MYRAKFPLSVLLVAMVLWILILTTGCSKKDQHVSSLLQSRQLQLCLLPAQQLSLPLFLRHCQLL